VSPRRPLARPPGSSLWHWSSPHGGRALPATLRCGARTFLGPLRFRPARDHPIDSLAREVYPERLFESTASGSPAASAALGPAATDTGAGLPDRWSSRANRFVAPRRVRMVR